MSMCVCLQWCTDDLDFIQRVRLAIYENLKMVTAAMAVDKEMGNWSGEKRGTLNP